MAGTDDELLGRLVMSKGLAGGAQLQSALAECDERIAAGETADLGQVFVERGVIMEPQLEEVRRAVTFVTSTLRALAEPAGSQADDELRLLGLALDGGMLRHPDLERALEQHAARQLGKPLLESLIQCGLITEAALDGLRAPVAVPTAVAEAAAESVLEFVPEGALVLFGVEGDHIDRQVPLPQGEFVVGRAASLVQLVLADPRVSSTHARLTLDGDSLTITDCSANGTLVDGERMGGDPQTLQPWQRIAFGSQVFEVRRAGQAAEIPLIDVPVIPVPLVEPEPEPAPESHPEPAPPAARISIEEAVAAPAPSGPPAWRVYLVAAGVVLLVLGTAWSYEKSRRQGGELAAAQKRVAELEGQVAKLEAERSKAPDPALARTDPQPTRPDPEPTRPDPEPTRPDPEPTKPDPEPTKPDPEPTKPDPEPTKPDPEPTKPDPEPTKPDPEPTKPDPEPTKPDPEPTKPRNEPPDVRIHRTRMVWADSPFTFYRLKLENTGPRSRGKKGRKGRIRVPGMWAGFGYTLGPLGTGMRVRNRVLLPLSTALLMPDSNVPLGGAYRLGHTWKGLDDLGEVTVALEGRHTGFALFADARCETIELKATLEQSGRGKSKLSLVGGLVSGRIHWHPARQQVLGGEIEASWTATVKKSGKRIEERCRFRFEMTLALQTMDTADKRLAQLVNKAVEQAKKHILSTQAEDGSWGSRHSEAYPMGQTALMLQALLAAETRPKDERIRRGLEKALGLPLKKTYSVSAALMALEALYLPTTAEKLRLMTVAERKAVYASVPKRMTAAHKEWVVKAARWLIGSQVGKSETRWGYPPESGRGFTNSNSFYALQGLLAASRLGLLVQPSVWAGAMKHWLDVQSRSTEKVRIPRIGGRGPISAPLVKARGWGYRGRNDRPIGSMTCAAIASLSIVRGQLWRLRRLTTAQDVRLRAAIAHGAAWLTSRFLVSGNPNEHDRWPRYYLYSLERAGELSGIKRFGPYDWYELGAAWLVGTQEERGNWGHPEDTAFAVLFLKRATAPLETSGDGARR